MSDPNVVKMLLKRFMAIDVVVVAVDVDVVERGERKNKVKRKRLKVELKQSKHLLFC